MEVLQSLLDESGADQIIAEEDYTPYARLRSVLVGGCLPLKLVQGQQCLHPLAALKTDTAPCFRNFNPLLQRRKFDPEGTYIRRWVPELIGLDASIIHAPWEKGAGVEGYPGPIVEHGSVWERALIAINQRWMHSPEQFCV